MNHLEDNKPKTIPAGAYSYNNAIYVQSNRGYFNAPKKLDNTIPTGTPMVGLNIEKIPIRLWFTCVQFLKDSYDKHKFETQVSLFYHPENKTWKVVVFEQESSGMTTNLVEGSELNSQIRDSLYDEGYDTSFECTGHHHCGSAAFASGTDQTDEEDRPGLHFTLGKMGESKFDFHGRSTIFNPPVVNNKTGEILAPASYDSWTFKWDSFQSFIDVPEAQINPLKEFTKHPKALILGEFGLCRYDGDTLYPPEWIDRCSKKTWAPAQHQNGWNPGAHASPGKYQAPQQLGLYSGMGQAGNEANEEEEDDDPQEMAYYLPMRWVSSAQIQRVADDPKGQALLSYFEWLDDNDYFVGGHEEKLGLDPEGMAPINPPLNPVLMEFFINCCEEPEDVRGFKEVWRDINKLPVAAIVNFCARAKHLKLTPDYMALLPLQTA